MLPADMEGFIFLVPETQRSGTGDSASKYLGESAKRVLQRAFDNLDTVFEVHKCLLVHY